MQVFETEPTEAELATFVDPAGRSIQLAIQDDAERLRASPKGIPAWLVACSLAIPLIGANVLFVWDGKTDVPTLIAINGVGSICYLGFSAIAYGINRAIESKGDHLAFDKASRVLHLPRVEVSLPADRIVRFVELHAWHVTHDRLMGMTRYHANWICELTVLARNEEGKLARYSVLPHEDARGVAKLASILAEYFGVERQVMRMTWLVRRRLRAKNRQSA